MKTGFAKYDLATDLSQYCRIREYPFECRINEVHAINDVDDIDFFVFGYWFTVRPKTWSIKGEEYNALQKRCMEIIETIKKIYDLDTKKKLLDKEVSESLKAIEEGSL